MSPCYWVLLFGLPSENYLARLAFVDFDGAAALDARRQRGDDQHVVNTFLSTYCPKVVKATKLFSDWLR